MKQVNAPDQLDLDALQKVDRAINHVMVLTGTFDVHRSFFQSMAPFLRGDVGVVPFTSAFFDEHTMDTKLTASQLPNVLVRPCERDDNT
jgi:hypothetical protein